MGCLLASILAMTAAAVPEVAMRREPLVDFAIDEQLQQDGGVQYYYELTASMPQPGPASALGRFRGLDELAIPDESYQVLMSRLVYTVDRDISFFTEARARDVTYLRAVAPDMGITAEPDGSFRVAHMPSNHFRLTWFEAPSTCALADSALARFCEFLPAEHQPASVVLQRNFGFASVLGWRTAERAVTFTAHVPMGPGRTRLVVCTISRLHHLPPFFLGGRDRVLRESVEGAAALIGRMRSYSGE